MLRPLQVLEGLEAVRKRPGMYIGSTDSRGLMHCLWEIIDNAVDEALAGHCDRIDVVLLPTTRSRYATTRGASLVDIEPKTGLSGVEVVFTKLHAGGKFGGGSYAASGGLHGVGASVVNALSERLDVEVDRDGKTWAMSFHRGEPGAFAGRRPGADAGGERVHAFVGTRASFASSARWPSSRPAQNPLLARLTRSSPRPRRHLPDETNCCPRPPDGLPGSRHQPRRSTSRPEAARTDRTSHSGSTAASPSSSITSPPDIPPSPIRRIAGHRHIHPRPCPC